MVRCGGHFLPESTENAADLSKLLLPIQLDDHVQGGETARFTLVEYGDYECPACGTLFSTIADLRLRWPNDIRLVFRHYPLSGIHPRAMEAAEASEAASAQGRFWEMHDLLFAAQNALGRRDLLKYAKKLSLDLRRFEGELKSRIYEARIRTDFRRGVANGVYGTPGLFVNGLRYNGSIEASDVASYLEAQCE